MRERLNIQRHWRPEKLWARRRFNMLVRLFRRTHRYFGRLLVPFVLLCGATAILFNHPTWFDATSTGGFEEWSGP